MTEKKRLTGSNFLYPYGRMLPNGNMFLLSLVSVL